MVMHADQAPSALLDKASYPWPEGLAVQELREGEYAFGDRRVRMVMVVVEPDTSLEARTYDRTRNVSRAIKDRFFEAGFEDFIDVRFLTEAELRERSLPVEGADTGEEAA